MVKQHPYPMNPNYAKIVREEIHKFLDCGFIYKIEHTSWVSNIVIVPKKNMKILVWGDLKKVNAATRRDNDPFLYTKNLLKNFLDEYSGYNQMEVGQEDQHKTIFAIEFGIFRFFKILVGLTNALATFQRLMCAVMQVV